MTNADRRYLKQLRDAYARDLAKLKEQQQRVEIQVYEITRGLKHIDSVLSGGSDEPEAAHEPVADHP